MEHIFITASRLVIILDWIGGTLMAGSIWSAVFKKLSVETRKRWERNARTFRAVIRFWGREREQRDYLKRQRHRYKEVDLAAQIWRTNQPWIMFRKQSYRRKLTKMGAATKEQVDTWKKEDQDVNKFLKISLPVVWKATRGLSASMFLSVCNRAAKVGERIFFAIGYVVWCVAKLIDLSS